MISVRTVPVVLSVVAVVGSGLALSNCGGADGTPASTTKAGKNVYDPDHNVINLPPGPAFIIRMPPPPDGGSWRLFTAEDAGGVSLQGQQSANGAGDWFFNTIGGGGGALEFREVQAGSDEPIDTVTYEVNIK